MKGLVLIFLFFFFLLLVQIGFLPHFGFMPNLIWIGIVILAIIEVGSNPHAFYIALGGGLFVDLFSNMPIGFWPAIFFASVLIIKVLKERYVRLPFAGV